MEEDFIALNWEKQRKKLAEFASKLPDLPGVYLMQDGEDTVLYIGKAGSLKKRVGSYFRRSTDVGPWKQGMLGVIDHIETIECEDDWEAVLLESRLIKDHRPKYNSMQLDGKTYPYIAVTVKDAFPAIFITRSPGDHEFRGAKLFGPFASSGVLHHAVHLLQTIFKFRTCSLSIQQDDPANRYFRPCLLHAINRCTAPCANRITQEAYKAAIDQFLKCMHSKRSVILRDLQAQMELASSNRNYEEAGKLRDQIHAIQALGNRTKHEEAWQSEVTIFASNPVDSMRALTKALNATRELRCIEAFDIAHLQGKETVASKVCFVDGRPHKEGYRRYKIRTSTNDDYMSMREVLSRRYREAGEGLELYPDLIVIDGGKGQLTAAMEALGKLKEKPPLVISLAKKEELMYLTTQDEPVKLGRNNLGLKLVQAIRDEAHRFAQQYHHLLRKKSMLGE
ncbi:MAG: excinuclease ABC subunit UvrC [Phycisphaerales bacterium]|jgi:excinuclease ABC subunit C|nr:excinuclease ABC subunit UvrC [Phycisphaerales bacterium]